jgi:hypothetical protein
VPFRYLPLVFPAPEAAAGLPPRGLKTACCPFSEYRVLPGKFLIQKVLQRVPELHSSMDQLTGQCPPEYVQVLSGSVLPLL